MGILRWGIREMLGATGAVASYTFGCVYVLGYFTTAGIMQRYDPS